MENTNIPHNVRTMPDEELAMKLAQRKLDYEA
jgi:hypothetical protein